MSDLNNVRHLPVTMPFPEWGGYTVAVLDSYGNITIKTGQRDPFEETIQATLKPPQPKYFENIYKPWRNKVGYLSVDRNALIADLKQCVAEIQFQKKDGSRRTLHATLQPAYLPEEYRGAVNETANRDANPEVLAVWDVDAGQWRSFRLEWVYSVQIKDGY